MNISFVFLTKSNSIWYPNNFGHVSIGGGGGGAAAANDDDDGDDANIAKICIKIFALYWSSFCKSNRK